MNLCSCSECLGSGSDLGLAAQQRLDLAHRHAVFAAFLAIAIVPIESGNGDFHKAKLEIVHTYVNTYGAQLAAGAAASVFR